VNGFRRRIETLDRHEEVRVFLLLVFVMLLVALGVLFFVGTLFVQSFIFTEPVEGLTWRAPTAAAIMAVFFTFWCLLVVRSDATPGNIPYTTIFNFSFRINMLDKDKPAPELWADRYDGQVLRYVLNYEMEFGHKKPVYQNASDPTKTFTPTGVEAVEIKTPLGKKEKFDKASDGDVEFFRNPEGWTLEYDRDISGNPRRMSWMLLFGNLFLNLFHFALWLVCLWLILRFSLSSSFLFAAILWGLTTLALLPMLLDQAASYH
jgi:hypothetical protein